MAVLYLDEAGEEGFKDSSSEWFVLGGVLQKNDDLQGCIDCYEAFKARRTQSDWHFHFKTRSHDERLGFINAIKDAPYQAIATMFHKPSIERPENFKKKYYLYFYALRFLLERATKWAAESAHEPLHLMLSSRKGLEDENIRQYFSRVRTSSFVQRDDIVWDYLIHDKIHIHANKEFRGLQVADCVVSSIFKAIEKSEFDTLEPRYVTELRPLFEKPPYVGYRSISFWPSLPVTVSLERLRWRDT